MKEVLPFSFDTYTPSTSQSYPKSTYILLVYINRKNNGEWSALREFNPGEGVAGGRAAV